jgi:LacI family transcriptional regulator
LAVEYLIDLGHRYIAMLTNALHASEETRRIIGYQNAFNKHGLPQNDDYIIRAAPTLQGGYVAASKILTDLPEVTAIFAYNDLMATGALRSCADADHDVPRDCAVMGFDDISLASLVCPALTTIRYDKYQMGYQAMSSLLKMIEKEEPIPESIELDFELIAREST